MVLFTSEVWEVDPYCGLRFLQDSEKVELKTSLIRIRQMDLKVWPEFSMLLCFFSVVLIILHEEIAPV